ncbi:MAG: family 10 glycosylhydrolase [bacterium]
MFKAATTFGLLAAILIAPAMVTAQTTPPPKARPFEVGIWLNRHIMAKGEEAIVGFLDEAQKRGLTAVFPNYWFHGYVIYPGSKFVKQHPDFVGRDPLGIVIREAHARGIKVYPWAEYGFFTHYNYTDDQSDVGYILQGHPDWITRNREGRVALHNPKQNFSHYSLNPAHPEARAFLSQVLLEVMFKYPDADGLHLDRIRYQAAEFSYDDFSRTAFKKEFGIDPLDIATTDSASQKQWADWRTRQVDQFMELIARDYRARFPDKPMTAAVIPPYLQDEKFQRWEHWAAEGNLDVAMPMLYGGVDLVRKELGKALAELPKGFSVWAGIDASMGEDGLAQAIDAGKEMGATGVVLWDDQKFLEQKLDFTRWTGRTSARPATTQPTRRPNF